MDRNILYFVICIILIIIIILLIFLNVIVNITKIDPIYCPINKGEYGVELNKNIKIKNNCGINFNELCSFTNISTLKSAISKCNALFPNCDSFTYSDLTQVMNIIEIVDNNEDDNNNIVVYSRQTKILQ